MMNSSFAAFVMTYERASILPDTIDSILNQTYPPSKILIIDNSESLDTQLVIESIKHPSIQYHRVGYNAGPAGAARIGLEILSRDGYDWIYWGDDDNPPDFENAFELLFGLINSPNCLNPGIVSAVGQYFSRISGNIIRVSDSNLHTSSFVKVDSIAGGMSMIVNAEVIRKGAIPDEKLFFGFEELDFCLKVHMLGYSLFSSSELFLKSRLKYNRLNYERPLYNKRSISGLSRQYYSTRNLIVILKRNHLYIALLYQVFKIIAKSLYGFRYGFAYGKKNILFSVSGLKHGIFGYSNPMKQ